MVSVDTWQGHEADKAMLTLIPCNRRQWEPLPYREMPFHKNVERDGMLV